MDNKPFPLRVCVLGRVDGLYTRMVVSHLDRAGIPHVLLLEKPRPTKFKRSGVLSLFFNLVEALSTGRFQALPFWSYYTISRFLGERLYYRSQKARQIIAQYATVQLRGTVVPGINHAQALAYLSNGKFDVGLFADVGIVDGLIINAFDKYCLNAHPAPLPQCRGGGALINTLAKGLMPSASVHFATPGIDEGDILTVEKLKLHCDDCFNSVTLRLAKLCASVLVETLSELARGGDLEVTANEGQMHYWKDCTIDRQKKAEEFLAQLLKEV